jgi:hypothetical protein
VPGGSGEVRVRFEAQAPRVPHRAEHDLAGQVYGRLDRITVVGRKVPADETAQVTFVHEFRAEGVLHAEAVDIGKIAAGRDLTEPGSTGHQHRDQAFASPGRIVVPRPVRTIAKVQAGTPARADPAAGQGLLRDRSLRQDGRRADQPTCLCRPDSQDARDLLGTPSLLPQQAYAPEMLIVRHMADRRTGKALTMCR